MQLGNRLLCAVKLWCQSDLQLPRSAVWCLTFVAWFSPQKRPPRYQKLMNPCFSLPKAKRTSKSSTRKSKPKGVTTQMKAPDQYSLMVLFVPSVKSRSFSCIFNFWTEKFSCSVRVKKGTCLLSVQLRDILSSLTRANHVISAGSLRKQRLVLQTTLFSRAFSYVLSLELSHVECLAFVMTGTWTLRIWIGFHPQVVEMFCFVFCFALLCFAFFKLKRNNKAFIKLHISWKFFLC